MIIHLIKYDWGLIFFSLKCRYTAIFRVTRDMQQRKSIKKFLVYHTLSAISKNLQSFLQKSKFVISTHLLKKCTLPFQQKYILYQVSGQSWVKYRDFTTISFLRLDAVSNGSCSAMHKCTKDKSVSNSGSAGSLYSPATSFFKGSV